eukprot:scaffold121462_cov18-Tisochrysis_lutea.AAC.4
MQGMQSVLWKQAVSRTAGGWAYLACHKLGELGEREGCPVGPGEEQALQDHLVEVALCAPDQELVELRRCMGFQKGTL